MQDKVEATGATGSTGPTGTAALKPETDTSKPAAKVPDPKPGTSLEKSVAAAKDIAAKYVPPSISVIIILIVAWFVSNWARRTLRAGLDKAKFDTTLSKFFANAVRWIILTVGVLFCFNVFDINTTTFAAVLGAAGLAIGLALQGSLGNMAAGVMLLVFRPFKVGDSITVVGQTGVINEIDLFTTTMDTADGRRIIIPNGQIFGNTIDNATYHPKRRADIRVSVGASSDLDHARAILEMAAIGTPGRLDEPPPSVTLANIGPTLDWDISVWAKTAEVGAVRQALIKAVRDELVRAGFEMPSPVTAPILKQQPS